MHLTVMLQSIHGSLAHSKQQISANPANSEQIAARFVSGLIAEAKLALSEILLQLKKGRSNMYSKVRRCLNKLT